jgi:hypothetical protein
MPPNNEPLRSQWLRVKQVVAAYPLTRARIYRLIQAGQIKSFVLKDRGKLRGIRLIDRDSLDDYLQKAATLAEKEN